ncbi:hypothetical protein [Sedimenticola hydrogenitrophicus]|uniref:hypothetical protein n=1 Tax=Sedimenticola hydrogenitrophicus TaxID=2967975 RepID=UPI0021A3CA85|nr:hypothetical protein [Sedimenticola hydrogenitrophicus]
MTIKIASINALALFILTACSTLLGKPELTAEEMKERLMSSPVSVLPVHEPVMLFERTKTRAIANSVIASLAASAAGNMAHTSSPQQLQSNMEISREFGQQLHGVLPDGDRVRAGRGPDRAFAGKLAEYFANRESGEAGASGAVVFRVGASLWELGYESFLANNDYQLNYRLTLRVQAKGEESLQTLKTITCAGSSAHQMPLEQWQAENYREVDSAAHEIVEHCFDLALLQLGLDGDPVDGNE